MLKWPNIRIHSTQNINNRRIIQERAYGLNYWLVYLSGSVEAFENFRVRQKMMMIRETETTEMTKKMTAVVIAT